MRPYGVECKKCNKLIQETVSQWLVYAKNKDDACKDLNEAIKEHDIREHPDDGWAKFDIVGFTRR